MKRYAIWNKQDMILTPIGEVLTAEQWIERYRVALSTVLYFITLASLKAKSGIDAKCHQ